MRLSPLMAASILSECAPRAASSAATAAAPCFVHPVGTAPTAVPSKSSQMTYLPGEHVDGPASPLAPAPPRPSSPASFAMLPAPPPLPFDPATPPLEPA